MLLFTCLKSGSRLNGCTVWQVFWSLWNMITIWAKVHTGHMFPWQVYALRENVTGSFVSYIFHSRIR